MDDLKKQFTLIKVRINIYIMNHNFASDNVVISIANTHRAFGLQFARVTDAPCVSFNFDTAHRTARRSVQVFDFY